MTVCLGARTAFSFMRGFGKPEEWRERCEEIGVTHFCVADWGGTWGHKPFADAFKGSKVKLLFGVSLAVTDGLSKDSSYSSVTLIAKKSTAEMYGAVTLAHQQTFYRPRLTWGQVAELRDCVVIVNDLLPRHSRYASKYPFLPYAPAFPSPQHRAGFKLVTTIGNQPGDGLPLLRDREVKSHFPDVDIDFMKIAKSCVAELAHGSIIEMDGDLEALARAGAASLGIDLNMQRDYANRLEHELRVIREKNFENYFLFVNDLVSWAKPRMLVGPGRGSAGGSLLCYFLGITAVDPIRFGTMFERFIDIARPDLPDIDLDFPDTRREEVFEYLRLQYGADRVARLGTITEFKGKSALNDTARATGVPFDVAREIGKWTEGAGQGVTIKLKDVFEYEEVKPLLEKHTDMRLAELIDGHPRHHGVHAAGVCVTNEPVTRYGSVDKAGVIQMDMKSAESLGLVKMDALGLRTLSVIQETCDLAGVDTKTLYTLDWQDQGVYERIFNADRMTGIFQFEGPAVRELLRQVKIDRFDDLCAITSLARPGPLVGGAAAAWIRARNGEAVEEFLHPSLESTYGNIVYQEQFMAIARDIAGFPEPEVNGMRRAVGKKDIEKLRAYREMFVEGATAYFSRTGTNAPDSGPMDDNIPERERAAELWDEICDFGSYAFNFSHAVSYSMISFISAYLKLHYPLEFATAQLRHAADDDGAKNMLRELIEEGYEYVPFDYNKSMATWAIVDGKLYGGFDSVRGIGARTASALLAKRTADTEGWLSGLTESQRIKITKPFNTPWHDLTYFGEKYKALYDDPEGFKRPYARSGFRGPIMRIKDIPDHKGNYAFVGRIMRRQVRDMNDPDRLAKRNGQRLERDNKFANLFIEDDTGEIACTINRFKYKLFEDVIDGPIEGKDFFFRGDIIEDGRKWIFLSTVVELEE